jgi:hypothetical protein
VISLILGIVAIKYLLFVPVDCWLGDCKCSLFFSPQISVYCIAERACYVTLSSRGGECINDGIAGTSHCRLLLSSFGVICNY